MILVYHKIDHKSELGINVVAPEHFREHVDYLMFRGYTFLGISDYLRTKAVGKQRIVALMFDDAYENVYTYALPILQDRRIQATMSVITDYVGKSNTWDARFGCTYRHATWPQVQEAAALGWEIASHTCSHRFLGSLRKIEQLEELSRSRDLIESQIGARVEHLVYPFGRASRESAELALQAGYKSASVLGQIFHDTEAGHLVGRRPIYRTDRVGSIIRKEHGSLFEHIKEKSLAFGSNFTVIYKTLLSW